MTCPKCGFTAKNFGKSPEEEPDCPNCEVPLEQKRSRQLLNK